MPYEQIRAAHLMECKLSATLHIDADQLHLVYGQTAGAKVFSGNMAMRQLC